jgi:hypothetical protein
MVRSSMFNVNFLTRCFNCFRVLTYTGWQYVYIQTRFVWQLDSVHVGAAHRMEQIWETRMVDCRQSFGLPHSCYGRVRKRCDVEFFCVPSASRKPVYSLRRLITVVPGCLNGRLITFTQCIYRYSQKDGTTVSI